MIMIVMELQGAVEVYAMVQGVHLLLANLYSVDLMKYAQKRYV